MGGQMQGVRETETEVAGQGMTAAPYRPRAFLGTTETCPSTSSSS